MNAEKDIPFAPLPFDDKGNIKIQINSANLDNHLIFKPQSMIKFTKSLSSSMDFEENLGFEMKWVAKEENEFAKFEGLGYKFEGWGMKDYAATIQNITFGEAIEEIIISFKNNVRKVSSRWKLDPRKYQVQELIGHKIYHNLLKIYTSKIKKSKDIFQVITMKVIDEIRRQKGESIDFMGEMYDDNNLVDTVPCDDPMVLAGLCLVWPEKFFNINGIGNLSKKDLRNSNLESKCQSGKCSNIHRRLIWSSKTESQSESNSKCRARIVKDFCFCGKSTISAMRSVRYIDNTYEEVVVSDTNNLEIRELKEIKDEKGRKNTKRTGPYIIGPTRKFDSEKFTSDIEYRKIIIEFLLIDIFTKQLPRNGKNPIRGKELPLPIGEIGLLCSQIAISIEIENKGPSAKIQERLRYLEGEVFFLQNKYNQYTSQIGQESDEDNIKSLELSKEDIKKRLEEFEKELKSIRPDITQTPSERAAKHRLGVKITEIGRFLEWWEDIEPIFKRLYTTKNLKAKEPLRAIEKGIANIRGD